MNNPPLYEYEDAGRTFRLSPEGVLTMQTKVATTEIPWYKDTVTGKPWIPTKFKSFKSLIKQSIRDGDFHYVK